MYWCKSTSLFASDIKMIRIWFVKRNQKQLIFDGVDDIPWADADTLSCRSCHLSAKILFNQVNLTAINPINYFSNFVNVKYSKLTSSPISTFFYQATCGTKANWNRPKNGQWCNKILGNESQREHSRLCVYSVHGLCESFGEKLWTRHRKEIPEGLQSLPHVHGWRHLFLSRYERLSENHHEIDGRTDWGIVETGIRNLLSVTERHDKSSAIAYSFVDTICPIFDDASCVSEITHTIDTNTHQLPSTFFHSHSYMYPRKLLTRHFWTLQQRSEFAVLNLQDRISYNLKVFRFLQSKLSQVKNDVNYEKWRHALGLVGSGTHPTSEELISVKDLFAAPPYKTSSLSYRHVVSMLRLILLLALS